MIKLHKLLKYKRKVDFSIVTLGSYKPIVFFYKKENSKTKYSITIYPNGFINLKHIYLDKRKSLRITSTFSNKSTYSFNNQEKQYINELSKPFYKKFYGL